MTKEQFISEMEDSTVSMSKVLGLEEEEASTIKTLCRDITDPMARAYVGRVAQVAFQAGAVAAKLLDFD